jgi:hypothetical protein
MQGRFFCNLFFVSEWNRVWPSNNTLLSKLRWLFLLLRFYSQSLMYRFGCRDCVAWNVDAFATFRHTFQLSSSGLLSMESKQASSSLLLAFASMVILGVEPHRDP